MEIFSKIFLTATTGLFILLFMLLVDHPNRKWIGLIIFIIVATGINFVTPLMLFNCLVLLFPFIIFLDVKRLTIEKCIWFAVTSYAVIFIVFTLIVDTIPFYYYPVAVFLYIPIARKKVNNSAFKSP